MAHHRYQDSSALCLPAALCKVALRSNAEGTSHETAKSPRLVLRFGTGVLLIFWVSRPRARDAVSNTTVTLTPMLSIMTTLHNKFASERCLAAHAQRAHRHRTEKSKRVDDSCVCPVCKATFHTRVKVLNHVRSSECRTEVVDLPEETIVRCRNADAVDNRAAPQGRTQCTSSAQERDES